MHLKWLLAILVGLALFVAGTMTRGAGFSARRDSWPGEARAARLVRAWMLPELSPPAEQPGDAIARHPARGDAALGGPLRHLPRQ